jgi:hypothetical protein
MTLITFLDLRVNLSDPNFRDAWELEGGHQHDPSPEEYKAISNYDRKGRLRFIETTRSTQKDRQLQKMQIAEMMDKLSLS